MAKLIRTNGIVEKVIPENKKTFTLKELQKFVGGTIDITFLPSERKIVLNDNGKLKGLPKNEKATKIWKKEFPIEKYPKNNDELIVGNVLIVENLSELE